MKHIKGKVWRIRFLNIDLGYLFAFSKLDIDLPWKIFTKVRVPYNICFWLIIARGLNMGFFSKMNGPVFAWSDRPYSLHC